MLDQRFDPAEAETRLYKAWESAGCFKPSGDTSAAAYSIVIPPPNVTGVLHMGHALNNTLQDILVRFERMRQKNVLWQPGTDHAGIATQMVVERQLSQNQEPSRTEMGREAFLEKVWEWKEESGGQIINQLKRLGASCNWDEERFTMGRNPHKPQEEVDTNDNARMDDAVRKVFVQMYNTVVDPDTGVQHSRRRPDEKGLIYRAKRLVNWDPQFESAISNLEVENVEVPGHMWHFKYPLADGATYTYVEKDEDGNVTLEEERDYIAIATTRPETMLGDGAVAVHPSDERYASIVGKFCEIPVGPKEHRRLIPIITDQYPDPEFGSGAVKITGAHDFNDYEVAKRGNIPMFSLMNEMGYMRADGAAYADESARAQRISEGNEAWDETVVAAMNLVPEEYRGLNRFRGPLDKEPQARERVIADITAEGNAVMVPADDPRVQTKKKKKKKKGGDEAAADEPVGLVPLVENKTIQQPFGDRSKVVIEPMLTDQWFVDAETLAGPALEAVADGKTRFVPENWRKTYDNWLNDIQPWCISRQLWWGHRIPVWYGPALDEVSAVGVSGRETIAFVAETEAEMLELAERHYGCKCEVSARAYQEEESDQISQKRVFSENSWAQTEREAPSVDDPNYVVQLWRDPDVLDTWFSSALWPFSTLGWPEKTKELETFYPTSTLITGFDIIFFWVARMMMQGIHLMDEIPFKDVYIHALVLDENGKKMSKSVGNTIDPLDLIQGVSGDELVKKRVHGLKDPEKAPQIEKDTRKAYPDGFDAFGADALRFTLARLAGQGRNIRLSVQAVEGSRNFSTKLWNAMRFAEMNECGAPGSIDPDAVSNPVNRWILGELDAAGAEVTKALEEFRFNDAAGGLYKFVWNIVCDWYLELSKPMLSGDDEAVKAETRDVCGYVLDEVLKLLHPFMPFVTEELWESRAPGRKEAEGFLMLKQWPGKSGGLFHDTKAAEEIEWIIGLISEVRSVRADLGVPAGAKVPMALIGATEETARRADLHKDILLRLARLADLELKDQAPKGAVSTVMGETSLSLSVAEFIDIAEEKSRLDKRVDDMKQEIGGLEGRLSNQQFVAKAPPEVVEEQKKRLSDFKVSAEKLQAARSRLDDLD